MAVGRQLNLQGQWRLDVAHLRSIESAVAYDFDVLAGAMLGGKIGYIVNGFTFSPTAALTARASIALTTAGSTVIHYNGSVNGSVLMVPASHAVEYPLASTADGVWYIGLNYTRTPDASTADVVQFLNTSVNPPVEVAVTTPLAQTLNYTIVVSSSNFVAQGPTIVPLARVELLGGVVRNIAGSFVDCRRMYLRYNVGGDYLNPAAYAGGTPYNEADVVSYGGNTYRSKVSANSGHQPDISPTYWTIATAYPWGSRTVEDNASFTGGDKDFGHERNWKSAIMSRIWEISGGLQWYSDTTDRNTKLAYGPISTLQDNFFWTGTNIEWEGLTIHFATNTDGGTAAKYNIIADNATPGLALADGGALYVDVNRTTDGITITPAVAADIRVLGTPTVPGSRYILAWRRDKVGVPYIYTRDRAYEVGRNYTIASPSVSGVVRTATTSYAPTTPYAIMAASAANKAAATGMTRTTISAGTIAIGGEANDTLITISSAQGATVSSTSSNFAGLSGTGTGAGYGVKGYGGPTGIGVYGEGGASGNIGVQGQGVGAYPGISGTGGSSMGGHGVSGVGGSGGGAGVIGTGTNGSPGVDGTGGGAGVGLWGHGGPSGGIGVKGQGTGSGHGVLGEAGASGSASVTNGVYGDASTATTNGIGVYGVGKGSGYGVYGLGGAGAGVYGIGGSSSGIGVKGLGTLSGAGVSGTGGVTDGSFGVEGVGGGTTFGNGVRGQGSGSGTGVYGLSGPTDGIAVYGYSYAGAGPGVKGLGGDTGYGGSFEGNATRTALHLVGRAYGAYSSGPGTLASAPAAPAAGDILFNTTDNVFYGYTGTAWKAFH